MAFLGNTGLGDYIHYKRINYYKYGINRPIAKEGFKHKKSVNANIAAVEAYNELKQIVNNTIIANTTDTKTIENFYNNVLKKKYSDLKEMEQIRANVDTDEMEATLAEAIEKETRKNFERSNLGLSNPSGISGTNKYRGITSSGGRSRGNGKKQESVQFGTIVKLSEQLTKLITYLQQLSQQNAVKDKELKKAQENIQKIQSIKNVFLQAVMEKMSNGTIKDKSLLKFINDQGELNELGQALQAYNILAAYYGIVNNVEIGTAGEYFGAYAALISDKTIQQTGDTLLRDIKDSVVGTSGRSKTILTQISSTFVDNEKLVELMGNETWEVNDEGVVASIKPSQDTVDCRIIFGDSNNIFNTTSVNISFKNIYSTVGRLGSYEGVATLSEAPLLSLLQLVNTNFGNHYINYLVESGQYSIPISYSPKLESTIRYAVAVRAITGARNIGFEKLSNYFIVNIRGLQRIRVFSSSDILKALSPYFGIFNENYFKIEGLPERNSLPNVWNDVSVQGRITQILAELAKIKISASLTNEFFTKY